MSETRHPSEPVRPTAEPAPQAQGDPCGQPQAPPDIPHDDIPGDEAPTGDAPATPPRLQTPPRGRKRARPKAAPAAPLTAQQRLLLLDAWRRSGLPVGDFAGLVGLSKHTL